MTLVFGPQLGMVKYVPDCRQGDLAPAFPQNAGSHVWRRHFRGEPDGLGTDQTQQLIGSRYAGDGFDDHDAGELKSSSGGGKKLIVDKKFWTFGHTDLRFSGEFENAARNFVLSRPA